MAINGEVWGTYRVVEEDGKLNKPINGKSLVDHEELLKVCYAKKMQIVENSLCSKLVTTGR